MLENLSIEEDDDELMIGVTSGQVAVEPIAKSSELNVKIDDLPTRNPIPSAMEMNTEFLKTDQNEVKMIGKFIVGKKY